jgi:GT2 family glycosyltransferase
MLDTGYILDIIIINYKSTDFLFNNLSSVYHSIKNIPVRIQVHDNGSGEGLECVKNMFPKVNFIRNKYNMGFAKATNNALKRSTAPYIMIINPDTIIKDGFFDSILDFMDNNPEVGIAGPKIFNDDGTIQGSARSFPSVHSAFFGRSSFLTKLFPNSRFSRANILTKKNDGKTPMEVDWVSGACLVVRRQAFEDVGFLDESFFMYWEDVDWCKRMWAKGWKIVYFPVASIMHYIGGSSEKNMFQSVLEFHKSAYYFCGKHMRPSLGFLKPIFFSTYFVGICSRFIFVLFLKSITNIFSGVNRQTVSFDREVLK